MEKKKIKKEKEKRDEMVAGGEGYEMIEKKWVGGWGVGREKREKKKEK